MWPLSCKQTAVAVHTLLTPLCCWSAIARPVSCELDRHIDLRKNGNYNLHFPSLLTMCLLRFCFTAVLSSSKTQSCLFQGGNVKSCLKLLPSYSWRYSQRRGAFPFLLSHQCFWSNFVDEDFSAGSRYKFYLEENVNATAGVIDGFRWSLVTHLRCGLWILGSHQNCSKEIYIWRASSLQLTLNSWIPNDLQSFNTFLSSCEHTVWLIYSTFIWCNKLLHLSNRHILLMLATVSPHCDLLI